MLGLGVGIDYALFIVTRFREDLHKGMAGEEAAGHALDTAGRAVLFAGTTVVISVLGMLVMGLGFIRGIGIGSAIAVVIDAGRRRSRCCRRCSASPRTASRSPAAGASSPPASWPLALVGAGPRVRRGSCSLVPVAVVVLLVGTFLPGAQEAAAAPARRSRRGRRSGTATAASCSTTRGVGAIGGAARSSPILALPVFGLRLGFSDEGNYPEDTETRQAYDLLAEGFGPGFNGPLVLVAEVPDGHRRGRARRRSPRR